MGNTTGIFTIQQAGVYYINALVHAAATSTWLIDTNNDDYAATTASSDTPALINVCINAVENETISLKNNTNLPVNLVSGGDGQPIYSPAYINIMRIGDSPS